MAGVLEFIAWGLIISAGIVVMFAGVALSHQGRLRRARGAVQEEQACQHPLTEFTPSTGQTRCRTCGELIWQDMPQS